MNNEQVDETLLVPGRIQHANPKIFPKETYFLIRGVVDLNGTFRYLVWPCHVNPDLRTSEDCRIMLIQEGLDHDIIPMDSPLYVWVSHSRLVGKDAFCMESEDAFSTTGFTLSDANILVIQNALDEFDTALPSVAFHALIDMGLTVVNG